MDKTKLALCVGISFIIVGLIAFAINGIIAIVCLAIGVITTAVGYSYLKSKVEKSTVVTDTKTAPILSNVSLEDEVDIEDKTFELKYKYDDVAIACLGMAQYATAAENVYAGEMLEVLQEPTNPYDPKAVAISSDSGTVGYLHKGRLQDMANDYLKRGYPVIAIANQEPLETIALGFYKPVKEAVV